MTIGVEAPGYLECALWWIFPAQCISCHL